MGLGNPALVVGLGNPGSKYALTRHNAGFIAVDALAERWGVRDWQRKGEARYAIDRSRNAILVKPQSYMNLSGPPALGLATFYKVPPPRILVIVDDLDLPFGTLRIRQRGGSAGHNGMESILGALGTDEFTRLRLGIAPERKVPDGADYVLSPVRRSQEKLVDEMLDKAAAAVEVMMAEGVAEAMNRFNRRPDGKLDAGQKESGPEKGPQQ